MPSEWRTVIIGLIPSGALPHGQDTGRFEDMDERRIIVQLPDAARMASIVDAIETRMARHRRQAVVDGLLANANAPYIRPGRVGTDLRRRIAAEGRVA